MSKSSFTWSGRRALAVATAALMIAVSSFMTLSVTSDQPVAAAPGDTALVTWGYNYYGQLGHGDRVNRTKPVEVGTNHNWSAVSAGGDFTAASKADGTLWTWGSNRYGQLGQGDITDTEAPEQRDSPEQVGTDTDWKTVSAGYLHTVAVKEDGTLWTWGSNDLGQLGQGDTTTRTSPEQVGTDTDWSTASAGWYHTTAIKADGSLWAWGYGNVVGQGDTANRTSPEQVGTDTDWSTVSAGYLHTVAIKGDGTLWTWGSNSSGELGRDDTGANTPGQVGSDSNWAATSAGINLTAAVRTDGTLWTWGSNGYGALGLGDYDDRDRPVQVGTDSDWAAVAAGGDDYESIEGHVAAIKANGTLWTWGANAQSQLGSGGTTTRTVPEQVGADTNWMAVSAGVSHTVALAEPPISVSPAVGNVWVSKELEGAWAATGAEDSTMFTIEVTCQFDGETVWSGPFELQGGRMDAIEDDDGLRIEFPLGTVCFAEETVDGGATSVDISADSFGNGVEVNGAPGTVQDLRIEVVNTFDAGSLVVAKSVSGAGAARNPGSFDFDVQCTFEGRNVHDDGITVDLADGADNGRSDKIAPLPIGASCEVTELDAGGADQVPEPITVVIGATEGGAEEVEFVNVYSAGPDDKPNVGDGGAANPPATVPGTTIPVTTAPTFTGNGYPSRGYLPATGSDISSRVTLGFALLTAGAVLVFATRRRRPATA